MSDEDSEIIHYVSDDWKSQGSPMPTSGGWSKGSAKAMHRLREFDYNRPFFYMVALKWLPELAVFSLILGETEPPQDVVSAAIWYNLARSTAMLTNSEMEKLLASTETYRV